MVMNNYYSLMDKLHKQYYLKLDQFLLGISKLQQMVKWIQHNKQYFNFNHIKQLLRHI